MYAVWTTSRLPNLVDQAGRHTHTDVNITQAMNRDKDTNLIINILQHFKTAVMQKVKSKLVLR